MGFSSYRHRDIIDKLIITVKGESQPCPTFAGPEGCGSLALAMAYAQYVVRERRRDRFMQGMQIVRVPEDDPSRLPFCLPGVKTKGGSGSYKR